MDKEIEIAAKMLLRAKYAIAFTGAGISAESGIPTFRGKGGLWERFDPEEYATINALRKNPRKIWRFYREFFYVMKRAKPNKAHFALAELEKLGVIKAVITQNIDDLHERAGSKNVVKLHGWFNRIRCDECGYKEFVEDLPEDLPNCPNCGHYMRPDVVFFGEPLPAGEFGKALSEASKADLVLAIGTSGVVFPAAFIPYDVKNRFGKVIEVNLEASALTTIADLSIFGRAGEILPKIVKILREYI